MSFITDRLGLTGKKPAQVASYQASPVTTTTGTATPTGGGGVTTALSPELLQFYNLYLREAMENMPTKASQDFANQVNVFGQSMFGGATGLDTNQMTNDYYNQFISGLQPQREAENVSLANQLFSQGRTGLGTGTTGGYINPEQFSLFKARGLADQNLAFESTNRARGIQMEDIQKALGLYGMGQSFKTEPYGVSAGILKNAMNLGQANASFIPYGIQSGSAGANAGANILNAETSARNANLGFWGSIGSSLLKK
jgi:hypothetical protein